MNDKLFQKIFDEIQDTLPSGWKKVIFFAKYSEGSYSMKYYVKSSADIYIDCFGFKGSTKAKMIKLFMNLDKIISPIRKGLDEKQRWTVLTLSVDNNGAFKADYDYADLNDRAVEYEREWKEKYLV